MSKKWKAAVLLLVVLALAAAFAFSRLRWEKSWNFSESVRTLRNPARGFYIQVDSTRWQRIEKISGDVRVILLTLDLRDFAEQAIPDETLQELEQALSAAEQGHAAVVFRAAYGFDESVREPDDLETVGAHIAQIAQVLNPHAQNLLAVQAGVLGEYGEWHGGHFLQGDESAQRTSRLYVLQQWEAVLEQQIPVAVRRPRFVREAQEQGILTGRLCLHNDALLSTDSDMGTYDDPEMSFSEELQWVDEQLADQYNGGEMPSPGARNEPENAHAEFQRLHIGYLNQMYNQEILDSWRESKMPGAGGESAFSFIERHLGYRFSVSGASVSARLCDPDTVQVHLTLKNSGYAALPAGFHLYLLTEDSAGTVGEAYEIQHPQLHQISNGQECEVSLELQLDDVQPCSLSLQISPDLSSPEEDCVILANDGFGWESGRNRILQLWKNEDSFWEPVGVKTEQDA